MATESINSKLDQLAGKYYISHGSVEQIRIDSSVLTLKGRLKTYFASTVLDVVEFGSYKRDTILPRTFDENSDVDLMIVFNHALLRKTPGTYRTYLLDFATKYYSKSEVYKSNPTVVLELGHIKYDLVPAYNEMIFYNPTTYIPMNDSSWMTTDPNGFSSELTRINTSNGYHVKKVIRLLKAWNAKAGYPLESFKLEQQVARANYLFWGERSLENYFFKAIDSLSSYHEGNYFTSIGKVTALKENAAKVKSYLQAGNLANANVWLAHILPF